MSVCEIVSRNVRSQLTTSALAKTIGKAKLLITNPMVRKIANSKQGLDPDRLLFIDRLANNVGNMEKM